MLKNSGRGSSLREDDDFWKRFESLKKHVLKDHNKPTSWNKHEREKSVEGKKVMLVHVKDDEHRFKERFLITDDDWWTKTNLTSLKSKYTLLQELALEKNDYLGDITGYEAKTIEELSILVDKKIERAYRSSVNNLKKYEFLKKMKKQFLENESTNIYLI